MTQPRLLFSICLCCMAIALLSAQQLTPATDTLSLTQEQIRHIESMAADTSGGNMQVPNVFSPNGDQMNDYFEVPTDGVKVYELTLFTRTGTRIYHSRSPRIYWDGRSLEGKELPEGIYYYVIEEVDASDPVTRAGFIHLYR
jgi:gliding motility-associated-like protein